MFIYKKRYLRLGIALLLIVVNSIVVFYIGRDRFALPDWFSTLQANIGALFDNEDDNTSKLNVTFDKIENPQAEKVNLIEQQDAKLTGSTNIINHAELSIHGSFCTDKRPESASKKIYSWIDGNGIRHLSDKPRRVDSSTLVSVIGTIPAEQLSINYISAPPSFDIKQKIHERVMANKALFAQITPKELIKPVTINFRIFNNKHTYQKYQQRIAPSLNSAVGFYSSGINESVVLMQNEQQSVNTAVHEAMHSINRHWFGHMSKWLNEGIAEYAESSQMNSYSKNHWLAHIRRNGAVSLSKLFNVNQHQWNAQSTKMYATSWALIAFLMDTQPKTLSRLLLEENNNGCKVININDIERITSKQLSVLQSAFDNWVQQI
ncbi:hypothetical protein [Aliiglaciecola lipolytica]|uniref:DUF1570 domain-containing protein n=1 Tax=Aliiglaciecola lipolytica E3 TaxID=1127673 RepID=K6Y8Z0_9ALTE|nr:hypothetical protein [Aliiglaciecola lipolytica]GAC14672.1 hypothetical protein GLIP_2044 [Aliiglaciecola lipolytica E3]